MVHMSANSWGLPCINSDRSSSPWPRHRRVLDQHASARSYWWRQGLAESISLGLRVLGMTRNYYRFPPTNLRQADGVSHVILRPMGRPIWIQLHAHLSLWSDFLGSVQAVDGLRYEEDM